MCDRPSRRSLFRPSTVLVKIIRSHQIILDRLREARTAVGSEGFNETMHKDFASALFPYRLHSQRLARTLFYLGATSRALRHL